MCPWQIHGTSGPPALIYSFLAKKDAHTSAAVAVRSAECTKAAIEIPFQTLASRIPIPDGPCEAISGCSISTAAKGICVKMFESASKITLLIFCFKRKGTYVCLQAGIGRTKLLRTACRFEGICRSCSRSCSVSKAAKKTT